MKKDKITKIKLSEEDKQLCRGPRKPKGGGYHGDKRRKRNKSHKNIDPDEWEEYLN